MAAISALILQDTARGQFDWFDMSGFLDAGYRTWQGQEPYVDFFYLAQPLHLWIHALFFELFGFNQVAVLAHLHAVNTAAILCMAALAWRLLARGPAFLVTLLFALSFYGPIAHPWYDQNAFFFILAGLCAVEFARTSGRWGAAAAFTAGASAAAAFMVKANVGLAGGGTILAAAVLSAGLQGDPAGGLVPALRRGLASWRGLGRGLLPFAAGGAVVVAACLAALESPGEFFFQAFVAYNASARLTNVVMLQRVILLLPFTWLALPAALLARIAGRDWCRVHAWDLALHFLLAATGLATAFTGSMQLEAKITFCAPVLLYFFRIVAELPLEKLARELVESLLGVAALFLIVYAGYASWPPAAWLWRDSNKDNSYVLETASFRGWRCNPATGAGVDRAVAWIRENVPPDESLFVFPDCTIIYGMAERPAYKGVPFLWHYRYLPPPGPVYDAVRARLWQDPPRWVVVHVQDEVHFFDTNRLLNWLGFGALFQERYDRAWRWGSFVILRLKTDAAPPAAGTPASTDAVAAPAAMSPPVSPPASAR